MIVAVHIKMRRLREFRSCLALRHASCRAITQWRSERDGNGNDGDNAYSTFQLSTLFSRFAVLKKGSPGYFEPGLGSTSVRPFGLGTKRAS